MTIAEQPRPTAPAVRDWGSFVGGHFEEPTGDLIEVRDPARWEVIGRIADAGPDGVDRAVEAARAAFPAWRRTPARERAAVVGALADRLAEHVEEIAAL
ncbi:MAG TPA: aldehyde dehydrogenase family protein, partial [Candidatus Limnocylindrales bacterium]